MKRHTRKIVSAFAAIVLVFAIAACGKVSNSANSASPSASTGDNGSAGGKKYVIGWSTIYLTPSWMQQTLKMMENRIDYWKEKGVVDKLVVANANGDTSQQIAQIENMISQKYDAIIIDAGSSTALNPVAEKAMKAGIKVINFDSTITSDKITSIINTDQKQWGSLTAQWLADKIGHKGKIIAMNGPAGVAVSDERWSGAKEVFDKYPDIQIVANLNSDYNEGPAMQVILPALAANPDIAGIWSQGGSLSSAALKALQQKKMKLVPMPGENFNGFLKQWAEVQDQGFSSYAVGQPNWLGALAVEQAVRALQGSEVKQYVTVPLPIIDDNNLKDFVPNDKPDDYFPIKDLSEDDYLRYLGPTTN